MPIALRSGFTITLILLISAGLSSADDIPDIISYQGKVTDMSSVPVPDGTYSMKFSIFDQETGGSTLWDSNIVSVTLNGGIFNVLLGESPQPELDLEFDNDYWLEVVFEGDVQSPRQALGSVGYTYMASVLVPGTDIIGSITTTPYAIVNVENSAASGTAYGIRAEIGSTAGRALYGYASSASGTTYGVYGRNLSTSGRAVYGDAYATTGTTYGVYGYARSTSGRGVYGLATSFTGTTYGVFGESDSQSGTGVYGHASLAAGTTYGVYGRSESESGRGVYGVGYSSTGTNYGVYGWTRSSSGKAVYGNSTATTGTTYGVYGIADAPSARALCGWATSAEGENYGVYARSSSSEGIGVYGQALSTDGDAIGVYGRSDADDGVGVYGVANGDWCAAGHFVATNDFGVGVYGEGDDNGGEFLATVGYGISVVGNSAGGYFEESPGSSAWALVANETRKIEGSGTMSFVQNHPERDDRVVVYAAPEGDEVATYTRGTARLVDGRAHVSLGQTFKWVTNPDIGLTAHLTPRGKAIPLAVVSLSTEELIVEGPEDSSEDIVFDYLIYGLRIGFEEQSIVQEKEIEARIPSMNCIRERYAKYPDLRQYNALERFKKMRRSTGEWGHLDLAASQQLLNAIEEYDPSIHQPVHLQIRPKRNRRIPSSPILDRPETE